jgi:hypothetical protein
MYITPLTTIRKVHCLIIKRANCSDNKRIGTNIKLHYNKGWRTVRTLWRASHKPIPAYGVGAVCKSHSNDCGMTVIFSMTPSNQSNYFNQFFLFVCPPWNTVWYKSLAVAIINFSPSYKRSGCEQSWWYINRKEWCWNDQVEGLWSYCTWTSVHCPRLDAGINLGTFHLCRKPFLLSYLVLLFT